LNLFKVCNYQQHSVAYPLFRWTGWSTDSSWLWIPTRPSSHEFATGHSYIPFR